MKETFYFSHDYNARSDEKIKRLLRKYSMEGYGIYWAIIEDLYNNANALRLDYEGIAYELRVDENSIKSIINDFDLFVIEGEVFGSISVQRRLDERNEKSLKAKESANKRWSDVKKNANALQSKSERNAIKESKVKESKVKESKEYDFVSDDFNQIIIDWLDYKKARKESYKSEKSIQAFYNKLQKLSGGSQARAVEIIEQSMANNWAGIFELKTEIQKPKPKRDWAHETDFPQN